MIRASITAVTYALPSTILDNDQLAKEYSEWTAEKILAKTGIRERRVAAADEYASDLAVEAANALFSSGAAERTSVDYVLYCTQSPDYLLPSTSCLLQNRLNLGTTCGALDFNLGCSGYVYGLGMAKGLIESGQAKALLLITADTYSKFIHPLDKSVRTLFGDGASATLITARESDFPLIGPFVYGTDGGGARHLIVPTGGLRRSRVHEAPLSADASGNSRTVNNLYMNGAEIFNFTLRVVPETVGRMLAAAALQIDDIDLFIFHQANRFMLDHLQRKLKIEADRFWVAMEDVGNTVSGSIPIALRRAMDAGKVRAGGRVMLVGFGVGYSWAATLIRCV